MEVYKLPAESRYVVIAYTADRKLQSSFKKNVHRRYEDKIISVSCETTPEASYLVALKSKCEFLEILEKYNVILLVPYMFHRGRRVFNALASRDVLDSFIYELADYYGKRYITARKMRSIDLARRLYSNISKVEGLLGKLTEKELMVLRKAMSMGYFEIPRKITLEELGKKLDLSKVTVETHLRKVIRKILTGVLSAE